MVELHVLHRDVEEYGGEEDISSCVCPIGKLKILGVNMQAYISLRFNIYVYIYI